MLILFDVDATLISTSGAGIRAMADAGRELYGGSFTVEGIEFAGRLDPLIIADMLRANRVPVTAEACRVFRAGYLKWLPRQLADARTVARALPGVPALLAALEEREGLALGLLTGNFEETGSLKLRACGIEPGRFHVRVWGDDSASDPARREDLPGVAMGRYAERFGRGIEGRSVVVVGDTPHDVACARAHGCRALGVATGRFTSRELGACGASRVVENLSDTRGIVDWLVNGTVVGGAGSGGFTPAT